MGNMAIVGSLAEGKRGAAYLLRGAKYLASRRELWAILVAPMLLNTVLFLLFLWGVSIALSSFLALHLPPTWWGILLGAMIVVASLSALLFLGSSIIVFFGSVLNAPFYDVFAERITRSLGGVVPDHPWWKGALHSMKHSAEHLWWYLLVQAGLIILYIVPVALGPIAYVTLGFTTTALFLAIDFLDYAFGARGWNFAKRRKWCMDRKGLVIGFGVMIFLGLTVPLVNLFIPPIAITGAILLFHENADSVV